MFILSLTDGCVYRVSVAALFKLIVTPAVESIKNATWHGEFAQHDVGPFTIDGLIDQPLLVFQQLVVDAVFQIPFRLEVGHAGFGQQFIQIARWYQIGNRFTAGGHIDSDDIAIPVQGRAATHAGVDIAGEMNLVVKGSFQQTVGSAGHDSQFQRQWMSE